MSERFKAHSRTGEKMTMLTINIGVQFCPVVIFRVVALVLEPLQAFIFMTIDQMNCGRKSISTLLILIYLYIHVYCFIKHIKAEP